ncbi:hypothetical protein K469DRAFT_692237 [Zopfia rhizophila CBS 207.26]|uniref:Uncharacterized protein n=1 Tax=Zopfia rhizophila CBS 207.26 TaxID=1314779 RepID=A0A6A6DPI7_9PEZI|nr:hypothetical protein K469DRAFT_692237 [Zopfia rhizophila CBS 207.26]
MHPSNLPHFRPTHRTRQLAGVSCRMVPDLGTLFSITKGLSALLTEWHEAQSNNEFTLFMDKEDIEWRVLVDEAESENTSEGYLGMMSNEIIIRMKEQVGQDWVERMGRGVYEFASVREKERARRAARGERMKAAVDTLKAAYWEATGRDGPQSGEEKDEEEGSDEISLDMTRSKSALSIKLMNPSTKERASRVGNPSKLSSVMHHTCRGERAGCSCEAISSRKPRDSEEILNSMGISASNEWFDKPREALLHIYHDETDDYRAHDIRDTFHLRGLFRDLTPHEQGEDNEKDKWPEGAKGE